MANNNFKVRNAFLINDENGYWNVFVTGITNDSGLTTDSEYNLVTEWAIKRNLADALLVLNELSLTGLTDVDFSGLTEGQYMMFSGGTWINVDGSYVQPTYTNYEPTPEVVGGVEAGSTFSAVTLQNMWTDLLYPYQHPVFTAFKRTLVPSNPTHSDSNVEVGYTLWSGDTTFTWTVDVKGKPENAPDNIAIYDQSGGDTLLASGLAWDGVSELVSIPDDIQYTAATSYYWRIQGTDNADTPQTYSDTTYLNWWNYFYYGESSFTGLTGTGSFPSAPDGNIEGLSTRTLKNSVSLDYTFAADLNYKYYCIPESYSMTGIKDYTTNLDVDMAAVAEGYSNGPDNSKWYYDLVSLTNDHGIGITYKVFRTRFELSGSGRRFIYT